MKGFAHPPGVNGGQTEACKHVFTPLVCLQPNDIWLLLCPFDSLWKRAHSDRACLERTERLLGQSNVSDETLNSSSWTLFNKDRCVFLPTVVISSIRIYCFDAICAHFFLLANIFFEAVASTDIEAVFSSSDSAEPAGGTSEWHESRRNAASQHAFQDSTRFCSPADVGAEHIEPSHQPRERASVAAGDRFKSNLWHQTAF